MIGESTGSTSGSQRVNELVRETIERKIPGGIDAESSRLGISPGDLTFQLLAQIEDIKKKLRSYGDDLADRTLGTVLIYAARKVTGAGPFMFIVTQ